MGSSATGRAYLDHAATTPLRPEARDAMLGLLGERFGNPSGSHLTARRARAVVDECREAVAEALGAQPGEVVFTGSGTEADNLAVLGQCRSPAGPGGTAVVGAAEHDAVLECARAVGGRVVAVDADGAVDLDALADALDESVAVVSVMLANNEVGTVQSLEPVAELVARRAPRAVLHTDAVQGCAWLDVAVAAARADMVAISAHKFGGPQGTGALIVRGRARPAPVILGGGQERGLRSGTHNVAGIAGLTAALRATTEQRAATVERVGRLRDRLADGLLAAVPDAVETGDRARKVASNCHLRFPGVESEALLFLLDEAGVEASAGSACASGAMEPSHVLVAMGVDPAEAVSSLRLSLGWCSTGADVDRALEVVPEAVARLRAGAGVAS
ncbi:MAG TPA: cysteine desulfurase family protein [Acidimicrobiales bacterium]|nr:cysteine desulfurase family protein [Acidimicrobiales bacterium]